MPTIRITKKDGTVQVKQHYGTDYLLFNPQMMSGAQKVEIYETENDGIYHTFGDEPLHRVVFEGRVTDRVFSHRPNAENYFRDLQDGRLKPTFHSDLHLSDMVRHYYKAA